MVGGAGDDIFRYERGDGRDVVFDDRRRTTGNSSGRTARTSTATRSTRRPATVSKNGVDVLRRFAVDRFYDYANATQTYRRHLGAARMAPVAANAGTDVLELGVGIDIQDLHAPSRGQRPADRDHP